MWAANTATACLVYIAASKIASGTLNKDMDNSTHPGRNGKGQYLKGQAPRHKGHKKAPGQIVQSHETIGYRDHLGRWLPGTRGQEATKFGRLAELRTALLDACPADDLKNMLKELHAICMDKDAGRYVQLHAMELYFNRVLGKPVQEMVLEKQVVKTNIEVDFTKLSERELKQMETILTKTQDVKVLEYKPEANGV